MSLKSLKKASKPSSEEALLALLDEHCPIQGINPDSRTYCNRYVAEDVAENAAFERGDTGSYMNQDVYTLLLCFDVLPQGTVMVGCGNVMYSKAGYRWLEVSHE